MLLKFHYIFVIFVSPLAFSSYLMIFTVFLCVFPLFYRIPLARITVYSSRKLVCKSCRPAPPGQRKAGERQYTCSACKALGTGLGTRDDYWPEDFANRETLKKLICKKCRPAPAEQRKQRQPRQQQQQGHPHSNSSSTNAGPNH